MIVVALLSAVNVGGRKVPMAALRSALIAAGFARVQTHLASGNVVLASTASPAAIAQAVATVVREAFGVDTVVIVRSRDELAQTIAANPFPQAALDDPAHLLVAFAAESIEPAAVAALAKAIVGRETVAAIDRDLFIFYPDGIGQSKLTNTVIAKHLRVAVTARNWNTVRALLERCDALP